MFIQNCRLKFNLYFKVENKSVLLITNGQVIEFSLATRGLHFILSSYHFIEDLSFKPLVLELPVNGHRVNICLLNK